MNISRIFTSLAIAGTLIGLTTGCSTAKKAIDGYQAGAGAAITSSAFFPATHPSDKSANRLPLDIANDIRNHLRINKQFIKSRAKGSCQYNFNEVARQIEYSNIQFNQDTTKAQIIKASEPKLFQRMLSMTPMRSVNSKEELGKSGLSCFARANARKSTPSFDRDAATKWLQEYAGLHCGDERRTHTLNSLERIREDRLNMVIEFTEKTSPGITTLPNSAGARAEMAFNGPLNYIEALISNSPLKINPNRIRYRILSPDEEKAVLLDNPNCIPYMRRYGGNFVNDLTNAPTR